MLLYNTNGTVSDIVINAIIDGKVTSSLTTAPTIQQAFEASASNAIINKAIAAGSSSAQSYNLGYPTGSTNNAGYTYLSSATVKKIYNTTVYTANLKHNYTTPIMVDANYVFTEDLDTVYGTDSSVSVVNNFINQTSASFASAILSIIPNYLITGSIENDAAATAAASWLGYTLPTGSLYRTSAGVLRVKIS